MPVLGARPLGGGSETQGKRREDDQAQKLRRMTTENVQRLYEDHKINRGDKNAILRAKGYLELDDIIADNGYLKAIWVAGIQNIQKGWDNVVESEQYVAKGVQAEPQAGSVAAMAKAKLGADFYYTSLVVLGQIQMLTGMLNAVGDVAGHGAERMALAAGASPGVASLFGLAVNVGLSATLPTGLVSKGFVLGVQPIARKVLGTKGAAGAIGSAPGKGTETLASKLDPMEEVVAKGIAEAAKKDGMALEKVPGIEATPLGKHVPETAEAAIAAQQVARMGGEWTGVEKGVAHFAEPETGAALQVALKDLTPDRVLKDMNAVRETAGLKPLPVPPVEINFGGAATVGGEIAATATIAPRLPQALAGAKPRYNIGLKSFQLQFESDVDKAMFIVAQASPSKADAKYMKFLQEQFPGVTEAELRAAGQAMRATIKGLAQKSEAGTLRVPTATHSFKMDDFAEMARKTTKRTTVAKAEAELPRLKEKYGITDESMTLTEGQKPTRTMTPRQLYGYLKTLELHSDQLRALAHKALIGDDTDAVNFARFATELITGNKADRLRYSGDFKALLAHWDAENIANGNITEAMRTFARDLAAMPVEKLGKYIMNSQDGYTILGVNWWGMAKEGYAALLTPLSFPAAAMGNSIGTGMHFANTFWGSLFSADRSAGLTLREGVYASKALMWATGDALKMAQDAFLERQLAYSSAFTPTREIPGLPGWLIRKPLDTLVAMDVFFSAILERASFYQQYVAEGIHRGLSGQALGNFIRFNMTNAWPPPPHVWEEARRVAETATYQNTLGAIGQLFSKFVHLPGNPAFLYAPFPKSMVNINKYAWNNTPGLQLFSQRLYEEIAAGGRRADMAIGRITMSTLLGMFFWEMHKEGYLTGGGPARDSAIRKAWEETNVPYSIGAPGGTRMPLTNMDPGTHPLGFLADMAEMADQLDEMTLEQMGFTVIASIMTHYVDTGAWHSVGGIANIVTKLARKQELSPGERDAALSPWLTITTGGPLFRRTAQITDPVVHETRQYIDSRMSRVPGWSRLAPARRDGYGKVMIPAVTPGIPWFGYLHPLIPRLINPNPDRIEREGDRIGARLPDFEPAIGGNTTTSDYDLSPPLPEEKLKVPLNSQQFDRRKEIYKNLVYDSTFGLEKQLLDTKAYQEATPALKREMFTGMLLDYKAVATELLAVEDKELGRKMDAADVKSVLPLLGKEQGKAVEMYLQQVAPAVSAGSDAVYNNVSKYGWVDREPDTRLQSPRVMPDPAPPPAPKPAQPQSKVPMGVGPTTYPKELVEETAVRLFPGTPFAKIIQDPQKTKALTDELDMIQQRGVQR